RRARRRGCARRGAVAPGARSRDAATPRRRGPQLHRARVRPGSLRRAAGRALPRRGRRCADLRADGAARRERGFVMADLWCALFWSSVGLVLFATLGWPLVLALRALIPAPAPRPTGGAWPRVSYLIV